MLHRSPDVDVFRYDDREEEPVSQESRSAELVAEIERAARLVQEAGALVVCAGAGMGVDSGLPDFRGDEGFWKAYPPFRRLGLSFIDLANPGWFERDPSLAWGFYGHRLELYRRTVPHAGFGILAAWARAAAGGAFVFTSNVDGQFQRAGFDEERIEECHGSIHHLQCATPCSGDIWPAAGTAVAVDEETMRAAPPHPTCPRCGGIARPNILMFGDGSFLAGRQARQARRFRRWLEENRGEALVVVECGAGGAVPTVRYTSEELVEAFGASLVRINPREPGVPAGQVGLPLPSLEALRLVDASPAGR
jgi:NAD-dependent SIR2 family protein deacetylase